MVVVNEHFLCVWHSSGLHRSTKEEKVVAIQAEDGGDLWLSRPQLRWPMLNGTPGRELRWHVEGPYFTALPAVAVSMLNECLHDIVPQRTPETQGHGLPHLCIRSSHFPGEMVTMLHSVALSVNLFLTSNEEE